MATKAPTSPGTEDEGQWFVPMLGMGGASIIGKGMQSLKQTWADILRVINKLPTEQSLAELTGGINAGGRAAVPVREATTIPIRGLEKMPELESTGILNRFQRYNADGGYAANPSHFVRTSNSLQGRNFIPGSEREAAETLGGIVPSQHVMDRVMNSGLRNKILGFGNEK